MSISSEITRIQNKRDLSLQAVANKGVTVPAGSTIDDLPGLIALIGTGGSGAVGIIDTADSHGGTIRQIIATSLENDTVTPETLYLGTTAHNAQGEAIVGTMSGGTPDLQSKTVTVTPTESTQTQTVSPDSGYDGLSSVGVTVNPIPSNYIVPSGTLSITANGTGIDVTEYAAVDVAVPSGPTPTGTKTISISTNGTSTEDVTNYASAEITVNVPNTYAASDEGKVVSNGTLVSQTSDTVTANGTVDTTLINSLTVNVSAGAGYTRYATGTYKPTQTYSSTGNRAITTISTIGFTPTHFILAVNATADVLGTAYAMLRETFETVGNPAHYFRSYTRYQNTTGSLGQAGNQSSWTTQSNGYLYLSDGTVYLRTVSNVILVGGVDYVWYAYG